jgi:hypothetical protein
MKFHLDLSTLPVKVVLLILALTTMVALHINPTATPAMYHTTVDTTHANASPMGLVPWAINLLEDKALSSLRNTYLHYYRPDQIIDKLVDEKQPKKRDSVGIDLGNFESQH